MATIKEMGIQLKELEAKLDGRHEEANKNLNDVKEIMEEMDHLVWNTKFKLNEIRSLVGSLEKK